MPRELTRRTLAAGGLATGLLLAARAHAHYHRELLMAGTSWETAVHQFDSGAPGPTVMIVAGTHGNETAPPFAARALLERAPARGTLIVVPEVNRPALANRSRHTPGERHGDLNRNFPTRARTTPRGDMASALWAHTVAAAPDWVLDLHEGWGYSASSASMGSSVVRVADVRTDADTLPAATKLIDTINATIDERQKNFRIIGPGPAGSYARAVVERLQTPALVLETTWVEPRDKRVAQQLLLVETLLALIGLR
jgi:hypothetical protein